MMAIKDFSFVEPILDALQASRSPERFAPYLAATGGNRVDAMQLYTWNTPLIAAFYGPLQGLEVALCNAMHRELTAVYGPAWYGNPAARLAAGTRQRIQTAKDALAGMDDASPRRSEVWLVDFDPSVGGDPADRTHHDGVRTQPMGASCNASLSARVLTVTYGPAALSASARATISATSLSESKKAA
jgi:hypothetical protein